MPRLPDDILARIPELQSLCGDRDVARAVQTGDPFAIYRALAWARLRGRLAPHRKLLDQLVRDRHLFFRPLPEGLAGSPPLPLPFGAWLFAWGYGIALGLAVVSLVALTVAARIPELAEAVRLPRNVSAAASAYLAVNGVLFLMGCASGQQGSRRPGQVPLDEQPRYRAAFRRVLDLNLFVGIPVLLVCAFFLVRSFVR